MKNMCVITHTILGILYVFVHLTPDNALFYVRLLPARHQFIWPSPLIYNKLLNKTRWYPSGFCHLLWRRHSRGYITGVIRRGLSLNAFIREQITIGLLKAILRSFRGVILISLKRNTATWGQKWWRQFTPLRSILLHITFTIPKILRAYFRRNRKLLKFLAQSANYSIERYFTEALGIDGGYTGGIYCIHFSLRSMQALPQGSLFNVHSHLHALVPAGIMIAHHFLKTCPTSVPKYSEFTTLPVLKPAWRFKIGKSHPYPPLTAFERPPRTKKNLLDALDFGEYCETQFFDCPIETNQ